MTADHLGPHPGGWRHPAARPWLRPRGGSAARAGLAARPGSAGQYGWSGLGGTVFFVDPAEPVRHLADAGAGPAQPLDRAAAALVYAAL
jgi:hypothetical protein